MFHTYSIFEKKNLTVLKFRPNGILPNEDTINVIQTNIRVLMMETLPVLLISTREIAIFPSSKYF